VIKKTSKIWGNRNNFYRLLGLGDGKHNNDHNLCSSVTAEIKHSFLKMFQVKT